MGTTSHKYAADLIQKGPAWVFKDDYDVFRAPALIDAQLNVYQSTGPGRVYKFSPSGEQLWKLEHECGIHTAGALLDGSLWLFDNYGRVLNIDMGTGKLLWSTMAGEPNRDTATVFALNGTVVVALKSTDKPHENNRVIAAVSTTEQGWVLWKYEMDRTTFNFMASSAGDGTIVFQATDGAVFRVGLSDGRLLWKAQPPGKRDNMGVFTTGHTIIGPNDLVYSFSNTMFEGGQAGFSRALRWRNGSFVQTAFTDTQDERSVHKGDYGGIVRALRLSDGTEVWAKFFPKIEVNRAGAVGRLSDGTLAVIAAVGKNPNPPTVMHGMGWFEKWFSVFPKGWHNTMRGCHKDLVEYLGWKPKWLVGDYGLFDYPNGVVAFDAATGDVHWTWAAENWKKLACAGDAERLYPRILAQATDPKIESICLPDSWASPGIDGDGAVYAPSGLDGNLYRLRDNDGDGTISAAAGEVQVFASGDAFLGGVAMAPGLLVATPCGGGVYAFRQ